MSKIPINSAVVGTANANTAEQDAQALLRKAGIISLQNLAAYLPAKMTAPLPEIAPNYHKPPCSSEAALQLVWLVKHRQMRLQEIWIGKLIDAEMSLPYEWLVPILERGQGNYFHAPDAVLGLLGERGEWLAQQKDEWKWIFQQSQSRNQQRKQEETDNSQTKILLDMRRHNPAEGLKWLIEHWDELRPDGRRWLYLESLRETLDKSDTVWLMNIAAGLEDGASDVLHEAQVALQLLSLLPNQALIDDLCQKVFGTLHLAQDDKNVLDFVWSVSYEGQFIYKAHIGLTNLMNIFNWRLPLDAILKLIPMQAWAQHFGVNAEILMQAASQGTHKGVFADAWGRRILFEENLEFAMAWLRSFGELHTIPKTNSQYPDLIALELFQILSWEQMVGVLAEFVDDDLD